jgi:hypothetical protein
MTADSWGTRLEGWLGPRSGCQPGDALEVGDCLLGDLLVVVAGEAARQGPHALLVFTGDEPAHPSGIASRPGLAVVMGAYVFGLRGYTINQQLPGDDRPEQVAAL